MGTLLYCVHYFLSRPFCRDSEAATRCAVDLLESAVASNAPAELVVFVRAGLSSIPLEVHIYVYMYACMYVYVYVCICNIPGYVQWSLQ